MTYWKSSAVNLQQTRRQRRRTRLDALPCQAQNFHRQNTCSQTARDHGSRQATCWRESGREGRPALEERVVNLLHLNRRQALEASAAEDAHSAADEGLGFEVGVRGGGCGGESGAKGVVEVEKLQDTTGLTAPLRMEGWLSSTSSLTENDACAAHHYVDVRALVQDRCRVQDSPPFDKQEPSHAQRSHDALSHRLPSACPPARSLTARPQRSPQRAPPFPEAPPKPPLQQVPVAVAGVVGQLLEARSLRGAARRPASLRQADQRSAQSA